MICFYDVYRTGLRLVSWLTSCGEHIYVWSRIRQDVGEYHLVWLYYNFLLVYIYSWFIDWLLMNVKLAVFQLYSGRYNYSWLTFNCAVSLMCKVWNDKVQWKTETLLSIRTYKCSNTGYAVCLIFILLEYPMNTHLFIIVWRCLQVYIEIGF